MMLSLASDLLKKAQKAEKDTQQIKPLTVCFWQDFMTNPSVMYGLFSPTPRKLNYDPDKVKVMGTKDGMINQINVKTVEDLDVIQEELLGVPLLLRVWAEQQHQNTFTGEQPVVLPRFEGDLALLVDTSHPMIRPDLEKALDNARKVLQSRGLFCVELDFGPAIDQWMKANYPRGCCTVGNIRSHKARLCITNFDKPQHCFDCNALWALFLGPCWLFSAPCYKKDQMHRYQHMSCDCCGEERHITTKWKDCGNNKIGVHQFVLYMHGRDAQFSRAEKTIRQPPYFYL